MRARLQDARELAEAQAYAAKVVPEARGAAARVRTAASGYRTASIARATGDAERFTLLLDQYQDAPDVTRKRLWLETVQDVMQRNRKIVGGDSRQLLYVPMGANNAPAAPIVPLDLAAPTVEATPPVDRADRNERPGREEDVR